MSARLDAYDQCECGRERQEHAPGRAAQIDGCAEFRLAYRYLASTHPTGRAPTVETPHVEVNERIERLPEMCSAQSIRGLACHLVKDHPGSHEGQDSNGRAHNWHNWRDADSIAPAAACFPGACVRNEVHARAQAAEVEAASLRAALRKLVGEIDFDSDGARWHPDPGCLECTSGTTPNDRNTGPCGYHAAQALLAKEKA